jgi:hypothetical protein
VSRLAPPAWILLLPTAILVACSQPAPESPAPSPTQIALPPAPAGSLNGWILRTLHSYPVDGSFGYHWPKPGSQAGEKADPWEGTTQTLEYGGRRLTRGDPQNRSYCCGLTFEVYVCALRAAAGGEVEGLSGDDLHELRLRFFGDSAKKERRKLAQFGLTSLGLGVAVTDLEQARAGDFVQFWRHSGSGHSVIFVNWVRRKGEIVGITYWSTQSTTSGIGYNTEPIGASGINREEIYLGRASWPLQRGNMGRGNTAQGDTGQKKAAR